MPSNILAEFISYLNTEDYRKGLYVELSGLVVEITLLALLVPLVIKTLTLRRALTTQTIVDFRIFQIYQSIVRGFLLLLGKRDWDTEAARLRAKNNDKSESGTALTYGNLESLLYLAKQTTSDRTTFNSQIESLPRDAFIAYHQTAQQCLTEIDRLAPWVVGNRQAMSDVHSLYILARVLRDQLSDVAGIANLRDPARQGYTFYDSLQQFLPLMLKQISRDFASRRKLVDQSARVQYVGGMAILACSLLYIIPMRSILRSWARLRKKPYVDRWSPSPYVDALREWRASKGWTIEQAAKHLGLSQGIYRDFEMGYRCDPEPGVLQEPLAFWMNLDIIK